MPIVVKKRTTATKNHESNSMYIVYYKLLHHLRCFHAVKNPFQQNNKNVHVSKVVVICRIGWQIFRQTGIREGKYNERADRRSGRWAFTYADERAEGRKVEIGK